MTAADLKESASAGGSVRPAGSREISPGVGVQAPLAEPAAERASILLVDDTPENLVALRAVLAPLGQRLVSTQSGEQALRVLLREDIAVILLDVRMAGMDGLETARIIRSRPRTRRIPIIFLTAEAGDVREIALAYATGAVDFVIKPFEPDVLRAKVSVFVELTHERAERVRQSRARAQAEAITATVRKLQIVSDAALAHLELDELLPEILERASTLFDADASGVLLCDQERRTLSARAWHGTQLLMEEQSIGFGEGSLGRIASEGVPAVLEADQLGPGPVGPSSGIATILVAPLMVAGRLLGLLYLGGRPERRFAEEDLELLALAAERIAIAIDHAQRFAHELELAEVLQRSLLADRLPEHPRLELAARYLPSGLAAQVGGDWYDALLLSGQRVGLMIGDIVGHGVRAATTMGELRNSLRAFAIEGHSPAEALFQLNQVVFGTRGPGMVATALFLVIDVLEETVTLASAGHLPPAMLSAGGEVSFLAPEQAPPLGVDANFRSEDRVYPLAAGDTLLLFTDGLVERRDESIDAGLERLGEGLQAAPPQVKDLCDHLLGHALGNHLGRDDVAMLAARLLVDGDDLALTLPAIADSIPLSRHRLRSWLSAPGREVERSLARDVELACTEAATNAVRHAYGPKDATFDLRAHLHEDELVVEVRDQGRWRSPRGRHGGRGLALMRALCQEVDIERSPRGTLVRMRWSLRPS